MDSIYMLEKEEMWFLLKCYNDYIIDFYDLEDNYDNVPVCISEFYNNEYKEYYQYLLDIVEEDLYYVGVDDNDKIQEDFYIWKCGTNINIIKKWFKKRKKS